jgi:hypothetical protein
MGGPRERTEPAEPLDRPIRVVLFCGRFLEPAARRFLLRLEEHPEIALVAAFAQGEPPTASRRLADLWRRRGLLTAPLLVRDVAAGLVRRIARCGENPEFDRAAARSVQRIAFVPDVHAPSVLERVRSLVPDLGLIYGGPVLKPELFQIPRLGTLGVHHGRLPVYRGKKTTFWEMYHREPAAGVTIQRVNAGIDTGEVVLEGGVPVGRKSYARVAEEVQQLGVELYLEAILQVKRGTARYRRPQGARGPLFRDPTLAQLVRLSLRQMLRPRRR